MLGTRLSFPGFMFLWEDLVSHQLLAWLLNLGEITGCACLSPSRARSAEPRACRVWASPSLRWACWAGSVLPQAEAMVLEDILSAWSGGAGFACLFNRNSSSFWKKKKKADIQISIYLASFCISQMNQESEKTRTDSWSPLSPHQPLCWECALVGPWASSNGPEE